MRSLGDGSMDLPFEGQDRTDLTDDFVMSGGVVVMAALVPVDGREEPGLVFRFCRPDGVFLPPILLVVSPAEMEGLIPLVSKAARTAIAKARKSA